MFFPNLIDLLPFEYVVPLIQIVLSSLRLKRPWDCILRGIHMSSEKIFDLSMRCHLRCKNAQLFAVTNSSGIQQFVVSDCKECAQWLSMTTGHIRDMKNGRVRVMPENWMAKNDPFISALRRAVQAGLPGPIKRIENYAVINPDPSAGIQGGVFMPLSGIN